MLIGWALRDGLAEVVDVFAISLNTVAVIFPPLLVCWAIGLGPTVSKRISEVTSQTLALPTDELLIGRACLGGLTVALDVLVTGDTNTSKL
jgi:hypothetical protein